ncbi:MAG: UbiA family prenyltransferase [Parvibaculum sp.]|uniref:UbiA family prenyltransferase n=1 Tax=Parvibaculum sp. TaxID=2024848 RepID=UPI0025E5A0D4|nr:UbiA family prenyltransferase [Parvibaculum sp.]MCE9649100.1 UbiA family prenyltransferase [Parvibaculum sp.]
MTGVYLEQERASGPAFPGPVLCVDLDGTLCRSDTLIEAILLLIKRRPLCLFLLPFWVFGGKARFKAEIAARVRFDADMLPYNDELVEWLRAEHAKGRRVVLASGANERIARAVATHHGFFDAVVSSDDVTNRTGTAKAAALKSSFGEFDYVGNDHVDLPVWAASREAVLASCSEKTEASLSKSIAFARVFRPQGRQASRLKLWVKALRLHQWVKNTLMFVPLVLAHQLSDMDKLATLALGFMAFNIAASSVYVLNDLLDLSADRRHPRKRRRPFAAADLPLAQGVAVLPFLFLAGFGLALYASPAFACVLAGYYVLTLAYSFDLKRRALLDVFTLASLYTIRIIAGAVATDVELSPWLLGFSIFLFLSLGVVKRVAEIASSRQRGAGGIPGRGYQTDDLAILQTLGVAAGYASVVVLSLYVSAPEARLLYPHHQLLWLFAPLMLYWVSRVWLITHRGEMHDDPIIFALKDPASRIIAVLAAIVLVLAAI